MKGGISPLRNTFISVFTLIVVIMATFAAFAAPSFVNGWNLRETADFTEQFGSAPAVGTDGSHAFSASPRALLTTENILVNTPEYPEEFVPVGTMIPAGTPISVFFNKNLDWWDITAGSTITTLEAAQAVARAGIATPGDNSFTFTTGEPIEDDGPSVTMDWELGTTNDGDIVPTGRLVTLRYTKVVPPPVSPDLPPVISDDEPDQPTVINASSLLNQDGSVNVTEIAKIGTKITPIDWDGYAIENAAPIYIDRDGIFVDDQTGRLTKGQTSKKGTISIYPGDTSLWEDRPIISDDQPDTIDGVIKKFEGIGHFVEVFRSGRKIIG
jgi:hypothetical protein